MSTLFYVYIYEDPTRDNEPFYVGKGHNRRDRSHVLEAKKWNGKKPANRHKLYRIRKIWQANKNVIIRRVFNTYNEEEAFNVETMLI